MASRVLLLLYLPAVVLCQQCGTDSGAPVCSADEDCCKDAPGCTGACTECCVRQSTMCVAPRGPFTTSTCCSRWTVGCTVGSVGCCDPAQPWQLATSVDHQTTSGRPPGVLCYRVDASHLNQI